MGNIQQIEINRLRAALREKREIAHVAMCIWEHISQNNNLESAFGRKINEIGTVAFRYLIIDMLAPVVELGYRSCNTEHLDPFDWEFVPKFLDELEYVIEDLGWCISNQLAESIAKKVAIHLYC